jgi:hypothetical protein
MSCRHHTAYHRDTGDIRTLRLDALSTVVRDHPEVLNGLILVTRDAVGDSPLWQLHDYSPLTHLFQLTQVDAARALTVPFTRSHVADCCTITSEFANQYLRRPDGSLKQCPLPLRVLVLRSIFDDTNAKRVFDFVHVVDCSTVYSVSLPLPGRSVRSTTSSSGESRHSSHVDLFSDAALALTTLTRDTLAATSGRHVLTIMRTTLSPVEDTDLHCVAALADIPLNMTEDIAADILQLRFKDLCFFQSVTGVEADLAAQTKKCGARTLRLSAEDSLSDYHNFCLVLFRAFQFTPSSFLTQALLNFPHSMRQFLQARRTTEPDLATNGFCSQYLNLAIHALFRVLANPSATRLELLDVADTLVVNCETSYYQQVHATLLSTDRQANALMRAQWAASGGRGLKGAPSPLGTVALTPKLPPHPVKPLCYHHVTAKGCSTKGPCSRSHAKPTAPQLVAVKAWLTSTNAKHADKTPLVLDPAKL